MPTYTYMHTHVYLPCGALVERVTKLLSGGRCHAYRAYRPTDGPMSSEYSSLKTFGGVWYGEVGSRRISAEADALRGEERFRACKVEFEKSYEEAYALILQAFPHLAGAENATRTMGEIDSWE